MSLFASVKLVESGQATFCVIGRTCHGIHLSLCRCQCNLTRLHFWLQLVSKNSMGGGRWPWPDARPKEDGPMPDMVFF